MKQIVIEFDHGYVEARCEDEECEGMCEMLEQFMIPYLDKYKPMFADASNLIERGEFDAAKNKLKAIEKLVGNCNHEIVRLGTLIALLEGNK